MCVQQVQYRTVQYNSNISAMYHEVDGIMSCEVVYNSGNADIVLSCEYEIQRMSRGECKISVSK